nr:unnamed protein product [Callosobruchus analis]
MNRRCRSVVWDHFQKKDNNSAKCNYCSQNIKYTGGSLEGGVPEPSDSIGISRRSLNEHKHPIMDEQPSTSKSQEIPVSQPGKRSTAPYSMIKEFVVRPVSSQKAKLLDNQLVMMIVKECRIQKVYAYAGPGYALPTRKTVTNSLLPALYLSELERVKNNLKIAEYVCITTDSWTSANNESFTAVTAHYLTDNLEIRSHLLKCIQSEERHTAENISTLLLQVVSTFFVENKITACTTDNAANIVAAVRDCQWRHIPCFAHCINLIVQEGVREISETTKKVKNIVEFLKEVLTL